MIVLIDTSIWSQALRRQDTNGRHADELARLIREFRARIIGPIRHEVLSGIQNKGQFEKLKERLRAFPDTPIDSNDYEVAAKMYNNCRQKGFIGSNIDFLICAVAHKHNFAIFTDDKDFKRYAAELPIVLHQYGGR